MFRASGFEFRILNLGDLAFNKVLSKNMSTSKINLQKVGKAWLPAIICMAAIFFLSSQPKLPAVPGLEEKDKAEHLIAYFTLGLLVLRGIFGYPFYRKIGPYTQTLMLSGLFGASDEFHQHFVPGRTMDIHDWYADLSGILIAIMLVSTYHRLRKNGGKLYVRKRREELRGNRQTRRK